MKLTTHFHPVLMSRISESILSLPIHLNGVVFNKHEGQHVILQCKKEDWSTEKPLLLLQFMDHKRLITIQLEHTTENGVT